MRAQSDTANDDDLADVKRRLTRWRAGHLTGTRIPENLWRAATSLVARHGLSRTARELALDYRCLKERAAGLEPDPALHPRPAQPAIDAPASPISGFAELFIDRAQTTSSCVVEVEAAVGTDNHSTLRLDLRGYGAAELDAILNSIWRPVG